MSIPSPITENRRRHAIKRSHILYPAAPTTTAGAKPTRESVRVALAKTKDVRVVVGQGRYSVDEQRVPNSGMNVLTVKNGQFVLAP